MRGGNIVRRWEKRFRSLPVPNDGAPASARGYMAQFDGRDARSTAYRMILNRYGSKTLEAFDTSGCRDPFKIMDILLRAESRDPSAVRDMYRAGLHDGFVRYIIDRLPDPSGGF